MKPHAAFARWPLLALLPLALGCGPADGSPPDPGGGEAIASSKFGLAADVALHWAPVHYQDVDKASGNGLNGYADLITRFDNDWDWIGNNNWDNLPNYGKPAYAYYSVAETATHWFLEYAFYHARDWGGAFTNEHENDLEGVVAIVRKDGSAWGSFEGMVTVYHSDWRIYENPATASYLGQGRASGLATEDVIFEPSGLTNDPHARPMTNQQPEGHGLTACHDQNMCGFATNDSIRYLPNAVYADNPVVPPNGVQNAKYLLMAMSATDGLWSHRHDHTAAASWEKYDGNASGGCGDGLSTTCSDDAAGTPWSWANSVDHLLFADPAKMAFDYFSGWDNANPGRALSLDYVTNDLGTPHSWRSGWAPAAADGQTDRSVGLGVLDSRIYLFAKAVGTGAQRVNFSSFDGANWTAFAEVPSFGVTTDSQPAAATCNGRLYVVVKQGTGVQSLRWNFKNQTFNQATGWGAWATVPAATTNAAVGLACRGTRLFAFLKGGNDNHVYFASLDTTTHVWGGWSEVPGGGLTQQTPAAALDSTNLDLDVVVVGLDGRPYLNRLCASCGDFSWTGWTVHPGWTTTPLPVALAWDTAPTGQSGVFMFTRNGGRIDEDAWSGGAWRGRSIVRGHQLTLNAPAAVRFNGTLHLFAVGMVPISLQSDRRIWMTAGRAPGLLLSREKPTAQTSTYGSGASGKAVDGHTDSALNDYYDGHLDGSYPRGFTTHTNLADYPQWQVDLGSVRTIQQIDVWNRTDCCANRLREWSVWVSNDGTSWTKIFNDSRSSGASRLTVVNGSTAMYNGNLPSGTGGSNAGRTLALGAWTGRHVLIQINRTSEYLHLGEVQVWGF